MGIVFRAQHPTFGRSTQRLDKSKWERSPYYWWWEFLRRNEDYRACCRAGGTGPLAGLYADFGDVVSHDNFKAWWDERGYRLFAEQQRPLKMVELETPAQWEQDWTKDDMMVIAVPLGLPKTYISRFFSKMLKQRHTGRRGRKKASSNTESTARYPIFRVVSTETLRKQLAVYDAVMAKKRGEDKRTLAKIGADMGLVKNAMPNSKDDQNAAEHKRNVMAASVSRHFKDASRIVANTALGLFPCSDAIQSSRSS